MSETAAIAGDLRTRILNEPDVILDDPDLMRALVAANDRSMGGNIVDLRGVAMERLESRLVRLEDIHKSVIAAAYENLAGMTQVHRAITAFLGPLDFDSFLECLASEVCDILRVGKVRLVLESHEESEAMNDVLLVAQPGFCAAYAERRVTLRQTGDHACLVYGPETSWIKSEACLVLDFGEGRLPGMLAFGSADPHHFSPKQGTDLLNFLGGVFELAMRRWLD